MVNGQALSAETVRQPQQIYPVVIPPGRYWYDAISGAWGREGEPIAGQMLAGLSLGGPLQANASRGSSGVFINGRQITDGEKAYIERLCQTPVAPARYPLLDHGDRNRRIRRGSRFLQPGTVSGRPAEQWAAFHVTDLLRPQRRLHVNGDSGQYYHGLPLASHEGGDIGRAAPPRRGNQRPTRRQ